MLATVLIYNDNDHNNEWALLGDSIWMDFQAENFWPKIFNSLKKTFFSHFLKRKCFTGPIDGTTSSLDRCRFLVQNKLCLKLLAENFMFLLLRVFPSNPKHTTINSPGLIYNEHKKWIKIIRAFFFEKLSESN